MDNTITVVITIPTTLAPIKKFDLRQDVGLAVADAIDKQEYSGAKIEGVYLSSR